MAKYAALGDWLAGQRQDWELTLSFTDVEAIIGGALPESARRHRAWWANDPTHVQAGVWMGAGWGVAMVDQQSGRVMFRRGR